MNAELIWASGLFEGEGCLHRGVRSGRWPRWLCTVKMNDRDVVERFGRAIGFGTVNGPYTRKNTNSTSTFYVWSCGGFERTQALIAMLWDGLGERRRTRAAEVLREGGNA